MRILRYLPLTFWALFFAIQPIQSQAKYKSQASSNADQAYQQGIGFYDTGDWPQAAHWFRNATTKDPQMQSAWFNLALAYYQMNDFLEAELLLEKLFAINPFFENAQKLYGMALYHRGEYGRAIKAFNTAENDSPSKELRLARAISYIAMGEPKYALPDLDEILYDDPGHPQACLGKSAALMALEKHSYALRFLNRLIDNDPENIGALTNRALCHFQLGNFSQSENDFEKALSLNVSIKTLLTRAECRLANHQFKEALADIKYCLRLDPRAPEVYFVLGEIEMEQQLYKKAIESYNIAIDLDHTCKSCYLTKSEAEAHLSNYDNAVDGIYKVLEIEPENEKAKELLQWVYAIMDMKRK